MKLNPGRKQDGWYAATEPRKNYKEGKKSTIKTKANSSMEECYINAIY